VIKANSEFEKKILSGLNFCSLNELLCSTDLKKQIREFISLYFKNVSCTCVSFIFSGKNFNSLNGHLRSTDLEKQVQEFLVLISRTFFLQKMRKEILKFIGVWANY